MTTKFSNPRTLVTLTAPTCSGKSHLLEVLVKVYGLNRIISTTTRPPRVGEVDGLHYYFIDTPTSELLEAQGKFAELNVFNGVRYGVTETEMEAKLTAPSIVILDPAGVAQYEEYCRKKNIDMFKIFVSTPTDVCIERLNHRTAKDLIVNDAAPVLPVIEAHTKRVKSILYEESTWQAKAWWNVIADGTDLNKSLEMIDWGIASMNRRIK